MRSLAVVLALFLSNGAAAKSNPSTANRHATEADLQPVLKFYAYQFNVTTPVVIMKCGLENAYYMSAGVVLMCQELMDRETPGVARFILAHEMAHATMDKYGIPNSEAGADELGTLVELDVSRTDVWEGAQWFLRVPPEPGPGDPHPKNADRARMVLCLDDGHDGAKASSWECRMYNERAIQAWARLLYMGIHFYKPETAERGE